MKFKKSIDTLHKYVNRGKYNKGQPKKSPPAITDLYEIRKDGWRRKSLTQPK